MQRQIKDKIPTPDKQGKRKQKRQLIIAVNPVNVNKVGSCSRKSLSTAAGLARSWQLRLLPSPSRVRGEAPVRGQIPRHSRRLHV